MRTLVPLLFALAETWSKPVSVIHDDQPAITYRAQFAGGQLIVDAKLADGWHTFTMDNDKRAAEKLAGKKALGGDRPTTIEVTGAQIAGAWRQPEPKDFSNAEIRLYSWGFEKAAVFAAPVRAAAAAQLRIRGQACTEAVCKNIDVTLALPKSAVGAAPPAGLIAVR